MRQETIKVQIPDGWELVTEEIRIGVGHAPCALAGGEVAFYPKIAIRKVEEWKQPDFLKPGWIAMDEDGSWYWSVEEPIQNRSDWETSGRNIYLAFTNWTPPACNDWKKSKRRIE